MELKVSKLPTSFHYYDAVPIMMARHLNELKFEHEASE